MSINFTTLPNTFKDKNNAIRIWKRRIYKKHNIAPTARYGIKGRSKIGSFHISTVPFPFWSLSFHFGSFPLPYKILFV